MLGYLNFGIIFYLFNLFNFDFILLFLILILNIILKLWYNINKWQECLNYRLKLLCRILNYILIVLVNLWLKYRQILLNHRLICIYKYLLIRILVLNLLLILWIVYLILIRKNLRFLILLLLKLLKLLHLRINLHFWFYLIKIRYLFIIIFILFH